MAASLEENLTCSICLNIFTEPLVLGCSHSFCAECLQNCWSDKPRRQRQCPLCRRKHPKDPPSNLALRNVCEAFLQSTAAPPSSDPHSIEDDIARQKRDLSKSLLQLQSRLKGLALTEAQCEFADKFMETQVTATEELIRVEFERLRRVLRQQEETRLSAVRDEARQKRSGLKDKMDAVREQRAAVAKTISDATRKLQQVPKNQSADRLLLRTYKSLVELAQRTLQEEEQELGSGALLDQAKHLGNLDFQVWNSLRSEVAFCPVVLDPNTASSGLQLSANLRSLSLQGALQSPLNAERLSGSYWAVLGAEGLRSRVHSWDVDVSGSRYWALGVASRSERLPGILSELWRLSQTREGLEAGTLSGRPALLSPSQAPHTVRLVLDLDLRDLSFFDPVSGSLLHSFTLPPPGGALYPYFFAGDQGSLRLLPQEVQVSAGTNHL